MWFPIPFFSDESALLTACTAATDRPNARTPQTRIPQTALALQMWSSRTILSRTVGRIGTRCPHLFPNPTPYDTFPVNQHQASGRRAKPYQSALDFPAENQERQPPGNGPIPHTQSWAGWHLPKRLGPVGDSFRHLCLHRLYPTLCVKHIQAAGPGAHQQCG